MISIILKSNPGIELLLDLTLTFIVVVILLLKGLEALISSEYTPTERLSEFVIMPSELMLKLRVSFIEYSTSSVPEAFTS